MFLSSCYPGTKITIFWTQGNDGLWHDSAENPVISCLYTEHDNVLEIHMWIWEKTCHCEKCLKGYKWFFFVFSERKKRRNQTKTEWDGNGVVDWRKQVKCQGLLLITRLAFSNNWMDLWKGYSIHSLSYAHKLYKKHIVSKDLVTHKKKSRQCLGHTCKPPDSFIPRLNV